MSSDAPGPGGRDGWYRTLVERVGDPMYVLDGEGYIDLANGAMSEHLGVPREEVVGSHVSRFMPAEDVRRGTEVLLALADDPGSGAPSRWRC